MKILLLGNLESIHLQKYAKSHLDFGHDVSIVTLKTHCPLKTEYDFSEIDIYKLDYTKRFWTLKNRNELKKIVRKVNPNLMSVHYACEYGILAANFKNIPKVLTIWGSDVFRFPKLSILHRLVFQNTVRKYNNIISTSKVMKQEVMKYSPKSQIKVIPLGVDLTQFKIKQTVKRNEEVFIIGCIKSFAPVYGVEYLIDAFKIFFEECQANNLNQRIELHLYGKGPLENELKKQVDKLKLGNNIYFKGYINNTKVHEALSTFDLFCMPSIEESFGVAAVEAMAMGLPVIGTDAPGLTEVIQDNVTGVCVPRKNSSALAKEFSIFHSNLERRINFGENGRIKVEKEYNFKENMNELNQYFLSCE